MNLFALSEKLEKPVSALSNQDILDALENRLITRQEKNAFIAQLKKADNIWINPFNALAYYGW